MLSSKRFEVQKTPTHYVIRPLQWWASLRPAFGPSIGRRVLIIDRTTYEPSSVSSEDISSLVVSSSFSGPNARTIDALLGMVTLQGVSYMVAVMKSSSAPSYPKLKHDTVSREIYEIQTVKCIAFQGSDGTASLLLAKLDAPTSRSASTNNSGSNIMEGKKRVHNVSAAEHQKLVNGMEKLLSSGGFYYSYEADLTRVFHNAASAQAEQALVDVVDHHYYWNYYLCKPFLRGSIEGNWFVPIIQGYVGGATIRDSNQRSLYLFLISRRSCHRGGTRYNARGIDDTGCVGNNVESEQHMVLDDETRFTFTQTRGSVPVFWKQTGLTADTMLCRPSAYNVAAFKKHQHDLINRYGYVSYVDLLSSGKAPEKRIAEELRKQMLHVSRLSPLDTDNSLVSPRSCSFEGCLSQLDRPISLLSARSSTADSGRTYGDFVSYIPFDFHFEVKGRGFEAALKNLCDKRLFHRLVQFGYHSVDWRKQVIKRQKGAIRTNCLDCLDRTNAVQWYLTWHTLSEICIKNSYSSFTTETTQEGTLGTLMEVVEHVDSNSPTRAVERPPLLKAALSTLWAEQGDAISTQYTGTGSIISAVIRQGKSSISTNIEHAWRSLGRFYHNTFEDNNRQEAIDLIRGKHRLSGMRRDSSHDLAFCPVDSPSEVDSAPDERRSSASSCSVATQHQEKVSDPLPPVDDLKPLTNLRVWVGTWNLSGKRLDGSFVKWLEPDGGWNTHPISSSETTHIHVSSSSNINNNNNKTINPHAGADIHCCLDDNTSHLYLSDDDDDCQDDDDDDDLLLLNTNNDPGKVIYDYLNDDESLHRPTADGDLLPEVFVFAVQELVELTGFNVILGGSDKEREMELNHGIDFALRHLRTGVQYTKVQGVGMIGLYMVMYIQSGLLGRLRDVDNLAVKVGMKGSTGNKGAVCIRFAVNDTSLCFINVHLQPGQERVEDRKRELRKVIQETFRRTKLPLPILGHDVIVVSGDFNFRLDGITKHEMRWCLHRKWSSLVQLDQWKKFKHDEPFNIFKEEEVTFPPTYRFKVGSALYDWRRKPAWCDRILFAGDRAKCLFYESHPFVTSDHRPVCSAFDVDTRESCLTNSHDDDFFSSLDAGTSLFGTDLASLIDLDHFSSSGHNDGDAAAQQTTLLDSSPVVGCLPQPPRSGEEGVLNTHVDIEDIFAEVANKKKQLQNYTIDTPPPYGNNNTQQDTVRESTWTKRGGESDEKADESPLVDSVFGDLLQHSSFTSFNVLKSKKKSCAESEQQQRRVNNQ